MSSEKMLTRIGALLRQAESTDNPHEGEAFLAAAQRLATNSAIDLAVARAHTASSEKRATPTQRLITIGEPGKRGLRTYAQLFVAIAAANDVQCDITQTSTVIFAYGFAADVDVCEALYASLLFQMVRDSDAYIRSGAYRGETSTRTRKPVAGVTARLNFQMAYASRIGARLTDTKQETETVSTSSSSETALVLRNKEIELKDYYLSHSTARGTWKGGGHGGAGNSSHARKAGDRAARSARLGNVSEISGARGQLES